MSLGDDILATNGKILFNENDLFQLLITDLDNAPAQKDHRKQMSTILYEQTNCGARIEFDKIGFNITCIVEGSDAEFKERFDFPFHSHGLGEYLCDLEARVEDAWQDANEGTPQG